MEIYVNKDEDFAIGNASDIINELLKSCEDGDQKQELLITLRGLNSLNDKLLK